MKKFTLSLATVMAMSTLAIAGGDIAPVEPMVEAPMVEEVKSATGLYAGIAYGMVNTDASITDGVDTATLELDHKTVMLQAGYEFNPYIAIEGRYWTAVGDADAKLTFDGQSDSADLDDDSNAWGIYLKPMYPVTPEFTAYGLVGYGNVELDLEGVSGDESQFQWGLGASYAVNDNFAVFIDYVAMYDDDQRIQFEGETLDGDIEVDSWNFGVTYKF